MKKVLVTLLIASMGLSLTACGSNNAGSGNANSGNAAASTEGENAGADAAVSGSTDGSVLKINLASEPDYLDPALNSSVDGGCLAVNSFVGLYTYDSAGTLIPALGEASVSDDGTVYTFKMIESNGATAIL